MLVLVRRETAETSVGMQTAVGVQTSQTAVGVQLGVQLARRGLAQRECWRLWQRQMRWMWLAGGRRRRW